MLQCATQSSTSSYNAAAQQMHTAVKQDRLPEAVLVHVTIVVCASGLAQGIHVSVYVWGWSDYVRVRAYVMWSYTC